MAEPDKVRLYNTLTREVQELEPLTPGEVRIYCCGPTVYDFQHIGNFKTFIFEDVLVRTLRYAGYDVRHVMNITDVGHLAGDNDEGEDKMAIAMRREKKKSQEIAEFYTAKFFEDWDKLHLTHPTIVCKATEHITEMIELIKRIEAAGCAYRAGGNVYFDVEKFSDYGQLARLDLDKLRAGARVDVDAHKRNPQDFALWLTKSKFENQEMTWDSPWGRGYPGWHIECSAMSIKYLGEQFDIHCGGIDHIPVHHTNEIAQAEAATGKRWVQIWMHSEFLLLDEQKMSKSKGGFLVLDDVVKRGFDPLVYRMLILSAHYKAHLSFSWDGMENMRRTLEKLQNNVLTLKRESNGTAAALEGNRSTRRHENAFKDAIYNDLNTPQALAVMWKTLSEPELSAAEKLALLYRFDAVFGLGMADWQEQHIEVPGEVQQLLEERQRARAAKDWAAADAARDSITALGFRIEDSPSGPKVIKK